MRRLLILVLLAQLVACGGGSPDSSEDDDAGSDGDTDTDSDGDGDTDWGTDAGEVLFYRQGTGETDWMPPVFNEQHGYVYQGFAWEPEDDNHSGNSIICWDRDGNEIWRYDLQSGEDNATNEKPIGAGTLNSAGTRFYFSTYSYPGYVYCLDALTGELIWKCDSSKGLPADAHTLGTSHALSHDESVLYVGSGGEVWEHPIDNRFYAIDAETGEVQWIKTASHDDRQARPDLQALDDSETAGCGWWPLPAIGPDGTIYAANFNGILYAIDPADGSTIWQYETYYYEDGERRQSSYSIWHEIWGSPALNDDATVVYIGSNDWFLHAVDTATGELIWKFEACTDCESTTGTAEIYADPVVDEDGVIYFNSEDNYNYAINPDGTVKWANKKLLDYLVANGLDDALAEEEDGQKLCFLGAMTILEDGTLVAGIDTGDFYVGLSKHTGEVRWVTKVDPPWTEDETVETQSEAVVDPVTKRIFVGTGYQGGLMVLKGGSDIEPDAAWPKSQYDNRCSGNRYIGGDE